MKKQWLSCWLVAGTGLLLPGMAHAEQTVVKEQSIVASELFEGTRVAFKAGARYSNATLIITGPADYQAEVFNRATLPSLDLQKYGKVVDGYFRYQLIAATDQKVEILNPGLNNGRDDIPGAKMLGAQLSGVFCVKDGVIAKVENLPEGKGEQ